MKRLFTPVSVLLIVAVFCLAAGRDFFTHPIAVFEDSDSYLSFSLNPSATGSSLVRTPFFPFLINAGRLLVTDNESVRAAHLMAAASVLAVNALVFSRVLHPALVVLCCLAVFGQAQVFFLSALSEWTALCLLMLLPAPVFIWLRGRGSAALFSAGMIASLIALTRPSLSVVALLPLLMFLQRRSARAFAGLCLSFLPLLVWIGFNLVRTGVPVISPFGGISLFGVTSGWTTGDYEGAPRHVEQVLSRLAELQESDREYITTLRTKEGFYNYRVWKAAPAIGREFNLTYPQLNQLLMDTSFWLIRKNPGKYLRHVADEFMSQLQYADFGMAAVVLSALVVLLLRPGATLTKVCVIMLFIHAGAMLAASCFNVMFFRLFAPTFYAFAFSCLLAISCEIDAILHRIFGITGKNHE